MQSVARARDYRAEYAGRIARALAKGKTRQQARGHRAGEAAERREREREEFGLSSSEVRSIRAWCERFNNKGRDVEDVIDEAKSKGYAWFQHYRETWNAARRTYVREQKAGTYASRGIGYLEMLAAETDVEDVSWVYYH
jgi:hypothetical protein